MKILVSDPLHPSGVELLKKVGEVEVAQGLQKEQLLEKVKEIDALLVRSETKVTKEVIAAAKNLKVIGRAGVGVDNIDLEAATARGIVVVNSPEASSITVAEHTLGLMLSLARKVPSANASLKGGKWEKKKFMGIELRSKTLGVVGMGRIGSQVVKRAKAFEMDVLAYDPYLSEKQARALGAKVTDLETVLREADFISLHVPLTDKTRGLIGKETLEKMKKTAYVINCARGGIVDEKALFEALSSGRIAGAALDVFEKEPPLESPLLKLENIILTPHLGASTVEAQLHASVIACEEVANVLQNRAAKNVVNMPVLAPEALEGLKNFIPLAGGLGRFAIQLSKGRVGDVDVTYAGGLKDFQDLGVLTNALLCGLLAPILTEGINLFNAPIIARNRGIRVTEGKREDSEKYQNLIDLKVRTDAWETTIKGTLLGGEEARIVEVEGYPLDLPPRGRILLVRHEDRPGMIGKVAMALGERGINIGSMQVGRREVGGLQLMVLTVDQEVDQRVLEAVKGIAGVERVQALVM
ncbi:MAG: phosphoglycerate dehydrogenase [Euryarchaeota archaeon]|nr:phosphoglycerate dehydrogenase [Euryarchaeota archaeon]